MTPLLLFLLAASAFPEQQVRHILASGTGVAMLPTGRIEITSTLKLPDGSHDLTIVGVQTTLHASNQFRGPALLSCKRCRNITIRNLSFDGNRAALERPLPLPPTDLPFARFYPNNGVLLEDSDGLALQHVEFENMPNFAVIVNHSKHVSIVHAGVKNSGSRNAKGRNNTSGGILLEEGTQDFTIADSTFQGIRGNAVWTHSCYRSPRNLRGNIANNKFSDIGRDAIQIGHASEVMVAGNTGHRIGMQVAEVDVENGGTPVGIDTAGNVDRSTYEHNRFDEVNGKCIDLDGFHDGSVRGNTCVNRGKPEEYPYGNFGIALNNTSIEMRSQNIRIEDNRLEGMKFGGIFVIGTGHQILRNHMTRLNTSHCNETHAKFGCLAIAGEPGFLESGIYLARRADKRDPVRGVIIRANLISGWKMSAHCIEAAPGVRLADNSIRGNRCKDE